jgi:hypothetical protein
MELKEITVLTFGVALLLNVFWCLYFSYPVVLDKHIKRGQSWVYIPVRWKGFNKIVILFFGRLLAATSIVSGVVALWLFLHPYPMVYFSLSALSLCIGILIINKMLQKIRYSQQENAYFHIRDELGNNMEFQKRGLNRAEFDALASFKHQNRLREADGLGRLIAALKDSRAYSKKKRPTRTGV